MKELRNPFSTMEGYSCFGCSPENPMGLKMRFFEDGEEIVSRWNPQETYQGYHRVLHGGIQATLLDELASWYVFVKLKTSGVTGSMKIDYHRTVTVDNGTIELRAGIEKLEKKRAWIRCRLFQQEQLMAEALCEYAVFPEHLAKKRFHYPGVDAFYNADS